MLLKRAMIAKLIILLRVSIAISEDSELSYVSKNLHKTQVFIFYDRAHSLDQVADCLGTILSPRFILTTAMCIKNNILTLNHAVITKVLGPDSHKTLAPDQTNNIDIYEIEKFTYHPDFKLPERNFPDFAILKLTKDIANSEDAYVMNQKVEEFYPQDHPGVYFLKIISLIPKQPFNKSLFQINIVTYLTGQRRGSLNHLVSHYKKKKSVQHICLKQNPKTFQV